MSNRTKKFQLLPPLSQGTSKIEALYVDSNACPRRLLECASVRIDAALRLVKMFSYAADNAIDDSAVEASDLATAVSLLLSDGLAMQECVYGQLNVEPVPPVKENVLWH